jgi:hypothetical protein
LRDVFEYHRELSIKTYGLDPAHYIGLPQLTWDAGLKKTGIVLENLKEIDQFIMFEKMKRGVWSERPLDLDFGKRERWDV